MIYEFLRGHQSPWKPYFDVLPTEFNTLMFWSDAELDQLQASAVSQKIGKQQANTTLVNKVVVPVRQNQSLFPAASSFSDEDLLYLAHRMGSTIMAYAFDIEKEPSQQEVDEDGYASDEEEEFLPKGMVPMADMLNADADLNNARLFYGESVVTLKALKPIAAGEEIFNDYGPLPSADLLRRYGYITQNYSQYDVVEIPQRLVVDVFRVRSKQNSVSEFSVEGGRSVHCSEADMRQELVQEKVRLIYHMIILLIVLNILPSFTISINTTPSKTDTTYTAIPKKVFSPPPSVHLYGPWISPKPLSRIRNSRSLAEPFST